MRTPLLIAALATLGVACNAGPEPRDASRSGNVPIYNTAAVVENGHAVNEVTPPQAVLAILNDPTRDPRDRALDARYQAADLLTFMGVREGMRVAELTAGGGYLTELFARSVGPGGQVFANDPPSLLAAKPNVARALGERLARLGNDRVVRVDRELASPLPTGARDLDLVYLSLPYRSAESRGIDTAAMNRAAYAALKPGGTYVVLDFRPRMSGPSRVNLHALHEQESTNVRRQIEAAGFHFVTEGRFLRNDTNPGAWGATPADAPTPLEAQDRFLLAFVHP